LGDAVMSSIHTLLMIGGFIILFSVINKLLFHLHITSFLAKGIDIALKLFHLPVELGIPLFSGLFEMTIGSQLVSGVQEATLMEQAIVVSLLLGFGGFSIHAQVASILAGTDIGYKPFLIARVIQGCFAAFYTFIFWNPLYINLNGYEQPSNAIPVNLFIEGSLFDRVSNHLVDYGGFITISMLVFYVLLYAKKNRYTKKS
jgi:sporulation integral membrane protein YlbJ